MPFEIPAEEPELGVGNHDVVVIDARMGTSKAGNDMLVLEMADANDVRHTAFVTITPKTMWKVRDVFDAFGLEVPKAGEEFDEADFIDRQINIEITDQDDGWPPKVTEWAPVVGSDIPTDEPKPVPGARFGDSVPWDDEGAA